MTAAAKGSLLEAMLAVAEEAPTLAKDKTVTVKTKTGGEYSYSYAPLDSIVEKIGPLLVKNKLVWYAQPSADADGHPTLSYTLAHAPTSEAVSGEMRLVIEADRRDDVQALGSAITYARRYALSAVLNLVADTDDDGQAAGGGSRASSGRAASEKQLNYVRSLFKRHKCTVHDIRAMLHGAGLVVPADADPVPLVAGLTSEQASTIIEFLKDGKPVPTGESDVPGAEGDEFKHQPDDGADTPMELHG